MLLEVKDVGWELRKKYLIFFILNSWTLSWSHLFFVSVPAPAQKGGSGSIIYKAAHLPSR